MGFNSDYTDIKEKEFNDPQQREYTHESSDFEDFLKYMDKNEKSGMPEPRELILDLDSPLEQFLTGITLLSIAGIVVILIMSATNIPLMIWVIIPVITSILSVILKNGIDEYYVLDPKTSKILFRTKIFGIVKNKPIADFSDIFAASTTGNFISSKQSGYWQYCAVFILKNGRTIRITDHLRENLPEAKRVAEDAAQFLNIPFKPGNSMAYTVIEKDRTTDEIKLLFLDHFNYIIKTRLVWYIASIILIILFVVFTSIIAR